MNKLNTETQLPQTIVSDCLFRVCSKCDIEKEIIFFAIVGVSGICYQIPHLPMEQETLFYLGDLAH